MPKVRYNCTSLYFQTYQFAKTNGFTVERSEFDNILIYRFKNCPKRFFLVLRTSKKIFRIFHYTGEVVKCNTVDESLLIINMLLFNISEEYNLYFNKKIDKNKE